MPYGRRYRRSSYRYSYRSTRGVYTSVEQYLRQLFFDLPPYQLDRVFHLFGGRYGRGAERYARDTFPSWKHGVTNMAQQTLDRLLENVPEVLSFEGKVDVYRKLRESYRRKESVKLEVKKPDDVALIESTAERIAARARSEALPSYLQDKLSWLSRGDGEVARAMVAAVEAQEGRVIAANVRRELDELRYAVAGLNGHHIVEHTIDLPCGTIHVTLKRGAWRGLVTQSDRGDLQPTDGLQRLSGVSPRSGRVAG